MSAEFCGSFGVNTRMGFAASGAITAAPVVPATRMEILSENFVFTDQIVGGMGITGSIDNVANHLREGARFVQGGFVAEMGPHELAPFIRQLVSNSAANTTKANADLVPLDFTIGRDLVAHTYRHCTLQTAHIRCQSDPENPENQILKAAISYMGVQEHAATFPPLLALPTGNRYFWLMGDSTFTYNAATFPLIDFDIKIENQLVPLFRNQLLAGCFRTLRRRITVEASVPYSPASATALFGVNNANRAASITMGATNLPADASAYATAFNFATTRRISKQATTDGRGEIPLKVTLQAYQFDAVAALTITNAVA